LSENPIKLTTRHLLFLHRLDYELLDSGVSVREKDIRGVREETIGYDRIGKEAAYYLRRSPIALIVFTLAALLSTVTAGIYFMRGNAEKFAWFFWMIIAAIAFIFSAYAKREGFRLQSDFSSLLIIGNIAKTQGFVDALMKKKGEFIEERIQQYLSLMQPLEIERYLLGLRDGSVLANEHYQEIRMKSGLDYDPARKIGFSNTVQ
jgi:hypothetical protein